MKLILVITLSVASTCLAGSDLTLWYTKPAVKWDEALPLGNGRLGAMVFGGVQREHILFNEDSLWSGWAEPNNDRPGSLAALQKVRQLLREGNRDEAGKVAVKEFLSEKGYGKPDFGAYQAFADVWLDFDVATNQVENYRRDLDLDRAVAHVAYRAGGADFQREYFCSYPDQAVVMHFTSSDKSKISFKLGVTSPHGNYKVTVQQHGFPPHLDPLPHTTGERRVPSPVPFTGEGQGEGSVVELVLAGQVDTGDANHEGMKFEARLVVRTRGGTVTSDGQQIEVKNADAATVLMVGATNYKLAYPDYRGTNPSTKNAETLRALEKKSYEQLRDAHLADYQRLFRRVVLELGGPRSVVAEAADATERVPPTDVRVARYKKSHDDRGLETLLFQYGRYLLISSSRPGGLPANLQGLWNNSNKPPWNCDYHLNINLQMNYWPAGPGNLTECALPLMDWLTDLQKPGARTAKVHYNSRGWVVHHVSNVWGFTAPGSNRGVHMLEAESAAFICQNVWDYYAFTQDEDWLRKTGWPLLKGAAEFWVDNLQEVPGGYLAVSPSYSPEHGPLAQGTYWQVMIVGDLFDHCIIAGEILKTDREFCDKLKGLRSRLLPPKVGEFGQLCEWMDADLEQNVPKDKHRHISHMYAVYPGSQITSVATPELAAAARKSLDYRSDGGTGWSTAWKINLWARLHDGDRAWKLVSQHIAHDTLANLWDSCPPFQIDGNFGYTAGVCEMLLQSQTGEIQLLPALPSSWPTGSVKGLRTRGGFEVDIAWQDGKLTEAIIRSLSGNACRLRYGEATRDVTLAAGKSYSWNGRP